MLHWLAQSLISISQALNAIAFGGWADEQLSARCWRCRDKRWARAAMALIDPVFGLWQGPSHCRRAHVKEQARRKVPPELR